MRNTGAAFKFQPFSVKQKKVLTWWMDESPYKDYDIIIADGSVRSGKTVSMIDGFMTWATYTYKNQNFILAGRSMGALKRNLLKPLFEILNAKGITYHYNRSEHYIEIGSNTFYCFGANNEASQDVLQGLTAAGALADEAALLPQNFIEQMIARCSIEGAKIWMNCNPESPYHHLKLEYIDKADEKRILHLHFTLDDNLALSGQTKERYARLFTGLWHKRMILGLWVLAEGVIYDMFDDVKHVKSELPTAFDRLFVSIDYGTSNPTVFLKSGQLGENIYIIDEYYWDSSTTNRQKTDGEYSQDLKAFIGEDHVANIIIDPSAASFITQLKRDGFSQIKKADNTVLDGIRNVSNYLSGGRLFVYGAKCPNILKEFSSYVWDTKAQERGEDKPIKTSDHALDALRYLIQTMFRRRQIGLVGKPAGY